MKSKKNETKIQECSAEKKTKDKKVKNKSEDSDGEVLRHFGINEEILESRELEDEGYLIMLRWKKRVSLRIAASEAVLYVFLRALAKNQYCLRVMSAAILGLVDDDKIGL